MLLRNSYVLCRRKRFSFIMVTFYKPPKKQSLLNKTLALNVSRLDHNGCGVAQYQKQSVFIEQALPGEKVSVKVIEQSSKYIKAKLLAITSKSEDRVQVPCRYFSQCGGCNLQHLDYPAQLSFKQQKVSQLLSRANIDISALPWQTNITSDFYHYRRKARIGVQYNKHGEAIVGFRQNSSNNLINIQHCQVLNENIADIFVPLKKVLDTLTGHKSVGHIEVISADRVCVVVRQLIKLPAEDKALWLAAAQEHQWQVIIDDGKTLQPLSNEDASLALTYSLLDDSEIRFSPNDFIQVNHKINQLMVQQAINWLELTNTDQVLDLFCGLGNFSLPIAKQVSSVTGVEGVTAMVDKAGENASLNKLNNCHFYHADLNSDWQDAPWLATQYNKIVLDPARAGAEQAVEQISQFKAEKVLYISCDPSSLARDTALMIKQGYKIEKIALMDMFSQTKHIETMVLFVPSK